MELMLLAILAIIGVVLLAGALFVGFAVGLFYACVSYMARAESTGGRPWPWLRSCSWLRRALGWWCPLTIHWPEEVPGGGHRRRNGGEEGEGGDGGREEEGGPEKGEEEEGEGEGEAVPERDPEGEGVLYAHYPHGLWPWSMPLAHGLFTAVNQSEHAQRTRPDNHRIAVTRILFWFPGICDIARWVGCIDAGRDSIVAAMDKQHCVHVTPGGVQEVVMASRNKLRLHLRHLGFLRLARERGWPVRAVFDADEVSLYTSCSWPKFLRRLTHRIIGWPVPTFFWGPYSTRLRSFVGPLLRHAADQTPEQWECVFFASLFGLIRQHNAPHVTIDPALEREMTHLEQHGTLSWHVR